MDHSEDRTDPEFEAGDDGQSKALNRGSDAPNGRSRRADLNRESISASAIAPFLERAEARGPRSRFNSLFAYGSQAALIVCVAGFAWAGGAHFFSRTESSRPATAPIEPSQESVERAEILRTTQKMTEDMRALKANVEALRASLAQAQNAQSLRPLEKALDGLKARLDAAKTETGASIAELAGKVERLQREPPAKLQQVVERLDRIERQTAAPLAASPPPSPAKAATASRTQVAMADSRLRPDPFDARKRPPLIRNWVVRDVYDGVALVENAHGAIEVALGEVIPGAGTVRSIERRGGGWIVITNRGLVDSARGSFLP